jgi:hypothetical protein
MAQPARRRRQRGARALAAAAAAASAGLVVLLAASACQAHRDASDAASWSRLLAEHHANTTVAAPHLLQLHPHDAAAIGGVGGGGGGVGGGLLPPGGGGRALLGSGGGPGGGGGDGDLHAARRRALRASNDQWRDTGRYAVLRNPDMPDGRSSTGQVAIHAVLLPNSYRILIAGRNLPKSGPKSIPEPQVYGNVSTVYDAKRGTYVVAENYETLFCTGHSHASDGTIVAAGGDAGRGYSWMREGRDVVRLFDPSTLRWETLPGVKLSEYRWYPTQVPLPDDRVVIVSGFLDDPGVPTGKPAPSIDIFDYRSRQIVARRSRYDLGKGFFTNVTPGYQLYPTVFLMPWTDPDAPGEWRVFFLVLFVARGFCAGGAPARAPTSLPPLSLTRLLPPFKPEKNNNQKHKTTGDYFLFFYTCRTGQIVRLTAQNEFKVLHTLPGLPVDNVCAAFSAMGSAVMLPFKKDPKDGTYKFEIVMFGGGSQGKGNKNGCAGECELPASPYAFRMAFPADPKQAIYGGNWPKSWQYASSTQAYETMSTPRLFADAVLLPNGKVLIVNGAKRGMPAGTIEGGGLAKEPNYQAQLYDPDAPVGSRFRELASSAIHRFYHSNALLLPSGDVWVAGSEHGPDCRADCKTNPAPPAQEYRAELFQPPYAFSPRPEIVSVSTSEPSLGGSIVVKYRPSAPGKRVTAATIVPPGSRTHGLDVTQRVVFLDVLASGAGGQVTLGLPTAASRVALPGHYMLWLLEGDTPVKEAAWIRVRA